MTAKTLMLQGTGSSVGKSLLAAALCRIFKQDGLRVAPFKSQNMALNSFVTVDGGEMGRAQVVQAEAAGIEPSVDMNPILIKPEADSRSQVVVLGKPEMTLSAADYYKHAPRLLAVAKKSLARLMKQYEVIVIEGAGSPAEINLKDREIVNMRIARLAKAPVLLVGDIDKGGVFASLVGTMQLLDPVERELVRGFIINKFRGDIRILEPGLRQLERIASRKVVGVVPYIHDLMVQEEDSVHRTPSASGDESGKVDVAVVHLPHISNSTDFEPLQQEPAIRVRYVTRVDQLGRPDVLIVPGSKSTISDLRQLRRVGLDRAIIDLAGAGVIVIGICGGFQMLGREIRDPGHVESRRDSVEGLGLLDLATTFEPVKTTSQVRAKVVARSGFLSRIAGRDVEGYEIHMGRTEGSLPGLFEVRRRASRSGLADGAADRSGNILGTYLHGLFDNANVRGALIEEIRQRRGLDGATAGDIPTREEQYDRLAAVVRKSLDMEYVYGLVGRRSE